MNRRHFVLGAAALAASGIARTARAAAPVAGRVTLLHTNDTHSRLEPFERGKLQGQGGIARRAALIARIRAAQPHTLVLDAGDIFQGTPYYNAFGGCAEFETMSAAGYDAVTLGNHDFDKGVEALVRAMQFARFSFLSANYDVDDAWLRAPTRSSPSASLRLFLCAPSRTRTCGPRFRKPVLYPPELWRPKSPQ